jgi:hypothetical protein
MTEATKENAHTVPQGIDPSVVPHSFRQMSRVASSYGSHDTRLANEGITEAPEDSCCQEDPKQSGRSVDPCDQGSAEKRAEEPKIAGITSAALNREVVRSKSNPPVYGKKKTYLIGYQTDMGIITGKDGVEKGVTQHDQRGGCSNVENGLRRLFHQGGTPEPFLYWRRKQAAR